jgi:sortase B
VNKVRAYLPKVIYLLSLSVFVYSLFELGRIGLGYYENRQAAAEAREVYYNSKPAAIQSTDQTGAEDETGTEDITGTTMQRVVHDPLLRLQQINPDITGWLRIHGTSVDYPIVQGADNEFYLNRNFKREASRAGSIFMDYRNHAVEQERNIVLYGHRMKDGSMFGNLKKYADRDFFEAHQIIDVELLSGSYRAEIFSVYYTTTDFDYIRTEFAEAADYGTFLQQLRERSLYKIDMDLAADDSILTLSTCDYTLDPVEGRLAVHAKLSKKRR